MPPKCVISVDFLLQVSPYNHRLRINKGLILWSMNNPWSPFFKISRMITRLLHMQALESVSDE
jgi:hypothetical protein